MRRRLLRFIIYLSLLVAAGGASLRRGGAAGGTDQAFPRQHLVASGARRKHCRGASVNATNSGATALLTVEPAPVAAFGAGGGAYSDGFSRVACEIDAAPENQRLWFKDHACGKVSSCRVKELPLTPRICFDFCRQFEHARFFGIIHGRDCYCGTYFHAQSTGGQGECTLPCEGDSAEMCGGPQKSSLFEMHMCDDSSSEAQTALDAAQEIKNKCFTIGQQAGETHNKLLNFQALWSKLDVCSVEPEGARVCALKEAWRKLAFKLNDDLHNTDHDGSAMLDAVKALVSARDDLSDAPAKTAALASAEELATKRLKDASAKAMGACDVLEASASALAGPILGLDSEKKPSADAFAKAFKAEDAGGAGWAAVCALEPMEGEIYAAMAEDDKGLSCADRCMQLSIGHGHGCQGYNYIYTEGLMICELLSDRGMVKPMLTQKVPVLQVSQTEVTSMHIATLGCFTAVASTASKGTHVVNPAERAVSEANVR